MACTIYILAPAILHVLNGWKNYLVDKGIYNSFSLYCSTVGRYFDPDELEYVELYLSFNEKDSLEGDWMAVLVTSDLYLGHNNIIESK